MDITKTDWDAYEAQLADNMTILTDSFSNLDSSDNQSWKLSTQERYEN